MLHPPFFSLYIMETLNIGERREDSVMNPREPMGQHQEGPHFLPLPYYCEARPRLLPHRGLHFLNVLCLVEAVLATKGVVR